MSRYAVGCFWWALYLALVAGAEYALITRLALTGASPRLDWIVVAGFAAPISAGAAITVVMFIGCILRSLIPVKDGERKH